MENKVSLWKSSINYGLIAAILLIALSLILWLLGMIENQWLNSIGYLILAFAMYLGAKNYRDTLNDGWLTYGEAFKIGFFVTVVAAVITMVYNYAFFAYIDPGILANKLAASQNAMLEANPNVPDEALDMAAKFTSPIVVAIFGLIITVIFGTIISLIVAIFSKKVNPADAV